jgi:predicted O-methyltransferase YrrM
MINELEGHPHVPAERAYLFRGTGNGTTEPEYLELLRALVRVTKPALIFESGAHEGRGTLALAEACRANCHGRVVSVDTDGGMLDRARALLDEHSLRELVVFVHNNSQAALRACKGMQFDFLFLDSDLPSRAEELVVARDAGVLAPRAIVVFHDTSPLRTLDGMKPDPEGDVFRHELQKAKSHGLFDFDSMFEFTLSRGLIVCRLAS